MRLLRSVGLPLVIVFGGYLVLALLSGLAVRRAPEGPHHPDEDVALDYRQSLARDVIAPVYDPEFIPAARADLGRDELVMGVEVDGEARAYPVGFLRFREIVNDRIGPVPFLVTW